MNPTREKLIPVERLRELLAYDPETGEFYRRGNNPLVRRWRAGQKAGSVSARGYVTLYVDGKSVLAHRAAIAYVTGEWPSMFVDHINGVKTDNRFENLRLASRSQNAINYKQKVSRETGIRGVWRVKGGAYRATIYLHRKKIDLGTFKSLEEAAAARRAAEERLHGEFTFGGGRVRCSARLDGVHAH